MMSIGSLIDRINSHKAWPYPRKEREVRNTILVTLLILLLTLAAITAGLKYEDEKTLGHSDLYFTAKNLTSYANETYLIATHTKDQPLVQPYRKIYMQQLSDDVDSIKNKLTDHPIHGDVRQRANWLLDVCDKLNDILAAYSRDPSDQTLARNASKLKALAEQAQKVEDSV